MDSARKKKIAVISILALLLIAVPFAIGYRIPESDQFPEWRTFPNGSNPRIAIQQIRMQDFLKQYPEFTMPVTETTIGPAYHDNYEMNLRNIKSLGFRTVKNRLVFGSGYYPGSVFSNTGGPQPSDASQSYYIHFTNVGDEYLKLSLSNASTNFKKTNINRGGSELGYFYQYNIPTPLNDTLFFNYFGVNFKAYTKN